MQGCGPGERQNYRVCGTEFSVSETKITHSKNTKILSVDRLGDLKTSIGKCHTVPTVG